MAEPISIQQLKDASLDVKSLEEVVNGDENVVVTTRLGETYPSVKGSIKKVFENGGLPAKPFKTKALMTASALVDGQYAMVTDDVTASNNALYVKNSGIWVKSKYDFSGFVKTYMSENGFAKMYTNAGSVDFNTTTNTLTFNSLLYVTTAAKGNFTIPSPVSLILEVARDYRIEFNPKTASLRAVLASSVMESDWLVAAYVTRTGQSFYTNDFLGYTVNGIDPNDALTDAKAYTDLFTNKTAVIVAQLDNAVTIDTVAKTLVVAASTLSIKVGDASFNVATQTVSLPSVTGSYVIVYDRQSTVISFKDVFSVATTDYVIGFVLYQNSNYYFNFRFVYKLDGFLVKSTNNKIGILSNSDSTKITVDTVNNKLKMLTGVRIIAQNVNVTLASDAIVDLPASTGIYTVDYDTTLKTIALNPGYVDRADSVVTFARLIKYSNYAELVGVDNYTINGMQPTMAVSGALYNTAGSYINLDTVNVKLTITSTRLVYNDNTLLIPNATLSLPTGDGSYRVEYNLVSNTIQIIQSYDQQARMTVRFAKLIVDSTKADKYTLYGVDIYNINGGLADIATTGTMSAPAQTDINFDFVNKKLIINGYQVRLIYGKSTVLLPAVNLDISASETFWNHIIYNASTGAFSTKRTNVELATQEISVGLFNVSLRQVYNVPFYSINGVPSSGNKTDLNTSMFRQPYGDVDANYNQPTLPSYSDLITADNGDYLKLIARYDALMSAYPDYITKTGLGNDSQGNTMYQYQFCAKEVETVTDGNKKPKIIMVAGEHGYEKAGVYHLYFALKEICERWQSDTKLEALKYGVNFIVVPVINMYGYNNFTRKNGNGVDIARNFSTGWVLDSDPASGTYGDTAPMSQAETIMIDSIMSNNRDAIYFGSHHNFFDSADPAKPDFLWNASGTVFGVNLAKNLIICETLKAKKRYNWMPQTNDYYIGYTGQTAAAAAIHANNAYGIQASTFECCWKLAWENGQPTYSSAVATLGTEALINWWLLNVKHAIALYNSRVNL